ncbi:MAG: glycosyltransferase family 39 protein [Phycisphaeraceae bacterium]|nr:glycosyltransferase family 39 protein [Phycisphaeraceae bacterium]
MSAWRLPSWLQRTATQQAALALLTLVLLAPFAGKAFHIDDPLFLWAARRMLQSPLDPLGGAYNWWGVTQPLHEVHFHPPGQPLWLALCGLAMGWSEWALHLGMIPQAIALVLGIHALGRRLCRTHEAAMLAAALAAVTPAFWVCSTTVMADTLFAALWVWAVVWWRRGLDGSRGGLIFALLLATAATLTKYPGVNLIPLLLLDGVLIRRKPGWWTIGLAIPLLALAAWDGWVRDLYGHSMMMHVSGYSLAANGEAASALRSWRMVEGLAFLALGTAVPLTWGLCRGTARGLLVAALTVVILTLTMILSPLGAWVHLPTGGMGVNIAMQWAWLTAAGAGLMVQLVRTAWRQKQDPDTWLLFCWIVGIFTFTTAINWTVNVRSMLPLLPAVMVLLARELERRPAIRFGAQRLGAALALTALMGLAATWSDFRTANADRHAARLIVNNLPPPKHRIVFQGHWGFQWYMQAYGAEPWDLEHLDLQGGDLLVFPTLNTNVTMDGIPPQAIRLVLNVKVAASRWIATMDARRLASFHASVLGCMPMVLGPVPPREYLVFQCRGHITGPKSSPATRPAP